MTTVTIEIDDKSIDGKRFLSFIDTFGGVSIVSKENKNRHNGQKVQKAYTALDFLDDWSGAFGYLDDEEADRAKNEYLMEKYG
jgi:hypothetical protein